ncbi:MAG: 30S ribosomal protein S21 [Candidatus Sungbacteria bacterium]|uniref:Small ribosomal subunit protein bS21 n=1 Tax=Candidatus Sungiibacteriota bacterium TaxID=2750080 RepID=A0A932YXL9_9BACT|nr:30S ribosomal protein S21 [Candidatus Sungbacteria bacterium]
MVYVKRKERESTAAMLRRFSRRVQASGILLRARKTRFYEPKLTKRASRERALRRLALAREREKLLKLGKLREEKRERR